MLYFSERVNLGGILVPIWGCICVYKNKAAFFQFYGGNDPASVGVLYRGARGGKPVSEQGGDSIVGSGASAWGCVSVCEEAVGREVVTEFGVKWRLGAGVLKQDHVYLVFGHKVSDEVWFVSWGGFRGGGASEELGDPGLDGPGEVGGGTRESSISIPGEDADRVRVIEGELRALDPGSSNMGAEAEEDDAGK